MFDTREVDGRLFVSVDDFAAHLVTAAETVDAMCGLSAPATTRAVVDTLRVTVDTLSGLQ